MIEISIVIVSWNAKALVRDCLGSLLRACRPLQTETIVVDNASSDGTPEMVEEEFPEVHLIRNGWNAGFATANNVGIRRARGKYIALINSDVTVPDGCLQKMFDYMEQNASIGMLGPRMLTPSGEVGLSCMRRPSLRIYLTHALGLGERLKAYSLHMTDFDPNRTQDVDVLNGWFWMVRTSALEQAGLLDEKFFMYGEDIDWSYRFWKNGWRVVYYAGAEATHYGAGSSSRAPIRFYIEMQRANMQYWRSHHNRLSQGVYVLIITFHQLIRVFAYGAIYVLKPSARSESSFKIRRSSACLLWLLSACSRLKPLHS